MDPIVHEPVTDDKVKNLVEQGITNSVGEWLNSSDLTLERQKATYEYGMLSQGHLAPQGVSQIVSSDTVEIVEGYLALLSELLMSNNRLAKFIPHKKTPTGWAAAIQAGNLLNDVIFNKNDGWALLSTWIKSALLWKNSIIYWDCVEDSDYRFKELVMIDQNSLDMMLAQDPTLVLISEDEPTEEVQETEAGDQILVVMHHNVRMRHKNDKTKIVIKNIRPELFRISSDASSLHDASFVAILEESTRSDVRLRYPDKYVDMDEVGNPTAGTSFLTHFSEEKAARKLLAGDNNYLTGGAVDDSNKEEPNRAVYLVHSWFHCDRDGDGIAEFKKFTTLGGKILDEEDATCLPMASLVPFEIPHEFHGLSGADMIRPTTLATTAVLRGFVENVYMTNYSPKLADPNVVDFGTLQNMKPKQLIPTNGNPQNAVFPLTPDTISSGTVPLLETMQMHKEQATGLSKAAQGLNDTLYVSGNSEEKLARVQSASQTRLQYMARRFVETGFKPLIIGIYKMLREKMAGKEITYIDAWGEAGEVDPATLPESMTLLPDVDVGEFGNSSMLKKLQMVGGTILPGLRDAGAGSVVAPAAAANIACQTITALNLNPMDYIIDSTTPEFKEQAEKSRMEEAEQAKKAAMFDEEIKRMDLEQRKATVTLSNIQSKNAIQDNARQLAIAMDASQQKWADLEIKALKEQVKGFPKPIPFADLLKQAFAIIEGSVGTDLTGPAVSVTTTEEATAEGEMPPEMNAPAMPPAMA
jgi:hypothetical protein